ncbi:GNAT family N-acetyltransferase [Streptococcus danieliae]|uniref:GNAT family N-acetyltransferase n=1 Tax=Streptococcus danieliae TaxID=747656 RepID=A0A7Z0RRC0_9STRE|nr:GNAT family N-acetyltransferase [Streptococcus danieliae]MBF0717577.1 GNAT family N-acetyltransferase [Streptococcus danieliae]NYS49507.1 GNAT family N-acetyltransferase [Streptococcus danieliae]
MIENPRFSDFLLRLPTDVQLILADMIPRYQQGYLDYVYQIEKVDIQALRIKNLVKNFRKMDYTYVMPMPQDLALEIIQDWLFPAEFVFSLGEMKGELLSPATREEKYFVVIWNGALLGYFRLLPQGDKLDLFLALKPKYLRQGRGARFYQTIEAFIKQQEQGTALQVETLEPKIQEFFRTCGFSWSSAGQTLIKNL